MIEGLKSVHGSYHEHEKNMALAAARNTAMKAARGDYFLFINDDTIAAPDLLEQHLKAHWTNAGEKRAVVGSFDFSPELLKRSPLIRVFSQTSLIFAYPEMAAGQTYGYTRFWTANASVPRDAWEKAGDFDQDYKHYGVEDTEWGYRLEKIGYSVLYCPDAKAIHEHDMSSVEGFCQRQRMVASNFVLFFSNHPQALSGPPWSALLDCNRAMLSSSIAKRQSEIERMCRRAVEIGAVDLGSVPQATADALVESLKEVMKHLSAYYWDLGLIEGLDRQNIYSFDQLKKQKLHVLQYKPETTPFKISVIIPTCNRSNILVKCLDSLAVQTLSPQDFEVLVCDDGSRDGTQEVLGAYSAPFRLQHFRHDTSKGPGAARNKSIKAASGELLLILNDDTICAPDLLEMHLRAHAENDGKKVSVLGTFEYTRESQRNPFVYFISRSPIVFAYPIMKEGMFYPYRYFWTCNISVRRQAVLDAGLFDEDFNEPMAEDTELGYRLEKMGYQVLYYTRAKSLHDHSLDVKGFAKRQEMCGRNIVKLFSKHPELLVRERDLFGFSNFEPETLSKFENFVNTNRSLVGELTVTLQKIHDLEIDDQGRIKLKNGLSAPADQLMAIIEQAIWPIHHFNLYSGIAKALQNQPASARKSIEPNRHTPLLCKRHRSPLGDRRLRILFTMFGWKESGGGTMHPRALALRLARMGHDVAVFFAGQGHASVSEPYFLERSNEDGVKLYGLWNRSTAFLDVADPDREIRDENVLRKFTAVLDEFKPEIVHIHNFLGFSFAIAEETKRRKIPVIYTPHNYHMIDPALYMLSPGLEPWKGSDLFECSDLPVKFPQNNESYRHRIQKAKYLLNEVIDCTLAISTRMREILIDFGGQANKIAVVHQIPDSVESLLTSVFGRNSLQVPLRFGFIGNVMPYKGLHKLFAAAQMISGKAKFLIYGAQDGTYAESLRKIDRKGVVRWKGRYTSSDLPAIASELDAVIVPSIWEEGAGLVNVESLAMKLPIIGARIGGIPDFVSDRHNGRLYPAHSEHNLAAILDEIIENPRQLREWRDNCLVPYTFAEYVEHLVSVYARFCEGEIPAIRDINLLFGVQVSSAGPPPDSAPDQPLNRLRFTSDLYGGFSNKKATGRLPHPLPSPLLLNIGCGADVRSGYVNIDLFSSDPRVVNMDIRKLDLQDGCADGILASDVLEHLSHREIQDVLREWARILKPGGQIEIRCPSLRLQAEAYLKGIWNADIASYMIFGGQTNPGDYHCTAFDKDSIGRHLQSAGLNPVGFQEFNAPQDRGFINLNMAVTAQKPHVCTMPANNNGPQSGNNSRVCKNHLNVTWEGSQFVYHSLALINRELCLKLIDAGHNVAVISYEKDQFGPEADPRFHKIASRANAHLPGMPDVHVRHQWPPNFAPPPSGHWVMIQPWEYGRLPEDWIRPMSDLVDEIWVPSRYVLKSYVVSGIPVERVRVIPNGVNTDLFHPEAAHCPLPTRKKFKFLFVGGAIWRKGIDLLLEAYRSTFRREDDVVLIVKDIGMDSFYKGQGIGDIIRQIQDDPSAPELLYLTDLIVEQDMPGLFTASDCLVHPYRGEGFGLPVLEAMACGIPVIVTSGGATDDFCLPEFSCQIPARRMEVNGDGMRLAGGTGYVLEPDLQSIRDMLRSVYENPAIAKQKAQRALEHVRKWYTWDNVAGLVQDRMRSLARETIRRLNTQKLASGIRITPAKQEGLSLST
jgi:glycosyltransferase involved in cell wall biosynthesis/GT2 family glycosyltransferase/SAM-dependent methyltransferase